LVDRVGLGFIEIPTPPPYPARAMAKKKKAAKKATKKVTKKVTKKAKKAKKAVTLVSESKPKPAPKKDTPPATPPRKPIDPSKLKPAEAAKRIKKIYELEAHIEEKHALAGLAKQTSKAANDALKGARAALATELDGQRFGPGELFNEDGSGPAGK